MTRDIPVIFVTVATTKQTAYDATLMDMHMPLMEDRASARRIPGADDRLLCGDAVWNLTFNLSNRADPNGRQVRRGRSHPKTAHTAPGAV
jgi:hypothetical protein